MTASTEPRETSQSLAEWIPPLLVVTAFMPYLSKGAGLRFENVIGAVLAVWATMTVLYRGRVLADLFPAIAVSAVIFVHIIVATFLSSAGAMNLKSGIGRLDHYSRPLAVLLICAVSLRHADRAAIERVFVRCARVLLIGVTVNALVQLATVFIDIEPFVGPFRPAGGIVGGGGFTVAEAAAGTSRFVGIFNQPIEHGAVYAIALVVWVWLWQRRNIPTWASVVSLLAIVIGGILASSKVFILGGIPAAIFLLLSRRLRFRDVALIVGGGLAVFLAFMWLLTRWEGGFLMTNLLSLLFNPTTFWYAVSGGRFGGARDYMSTEDLGLQAFQAARQSPVFGIGVGSSFAIMDNEYTMGLAEGGVFVLLLIVLRLGILVLPAIRLSLRSPNGRALLAIIGVVALGSVGAPITGIPRSGTVIWVFIGLLLLLVSPTPAPRRPTGASG